MIIIEFEGQRMEELFNQPDVLFVIRQICLDYKLCTIAAVDNGMIWESLPLQVSTNLFSFLNSSIVFFL